MPYKEQPIMKAIGAASLAWKRYAQKNIHPHGVTIKQFEVLRQLKEKGTLYPADIAEMLFCDRSTATVVIKNMEKKGWIERRLDEDDHRRFKVSLTKTGLEKFDKITWPKPEFKKKRFQPVACFTKEEKDQLKSLLAKLNSHLDTIK